MMIGKIREVIMLAVIRKYLNLRKLNRLPRAVMATGKSKKEITKLNLNFVRPHDFFILSYPRSGNTWLRLMICDLLTQKLGINTGFGVPYELFSPTIEKHVLEKHPPRISGFYLFKTHNHNLLAEQKFVYVYRDPVDSLVSYYRFLKQRAITVCEPELLEFCRREVEAWNISVNFACRNQHRCVIVKFEDMLAEPNRLLKSSLGFLNIDCNERQIELAVINNTIEKQKVRKIRADQGQEIDYLLSKGNAKGNYCYLDDTTISYIQEQSKASLFTIDSLNSTTIR